MMTVSLLICAVNYRQLHTNKKCSHNTPASSNGASVFVMKMTQTPWSPEIKKENQHKVQSSAFIALLILA